MNRTAPTCQSLRDVCFELFQLMVISMQYILILGGNVRILCAAVEKISLRCDSRQERVQFIGNMPRNGNFFAPGNDTFIYAHLKNIQEM